MKPASSNHNPFEKFRVGSSPYLERKEVFTAKSPVYQGKLKKTLNSTMLGDVDQVRRTSRPLARALKLSVEEMFHLKDVRGYFIS